MTEYLQSLTDAVLDRTTEELLGAVMIALALALALAGLYALGRRKLKDPIMLMTGLMLFANLASMVVAAAYVVKARKDITSDGRNAAFPPLAGHLGHGGPPSNHGRPDGPPGSAVAFGIVKTADTNNDGKLSPDEAAAFVRLADTSGKGSIDGHDLETALMRSLPEPAAAP